MADFAFSDDVTEKLNDLAKREGRSVEEVIREMMKHYPPAQETSLGDEDETPSPDPLVGLIGLLTIGASS